MDLKKYVVLNGIIDENGNPLKCKVKYCDMLKGNLIN